MNTALVEVMYRLGRHAWIDGKSADYRLDPDAGQMLYMQPDDLAKSMRGAYLIGWIDAEGGVDLHVGLRELRGVV